MRRFKKILFVNTDGNDQTSALQRAVRLAKSNQAGLKILDIAQRFPGTDSDAGKAQRLKTLELLVSPFRQDLVIDLALAQGPLLPEVVSSVLRDGYDLVIKPAENPGFLKRLFGSDDMDLLRKCPCPVWLLKLPEKEKYRCILAAVDFNPMKPEAEVEALNANILALAASLAISDSAALHLAHAWDAYAEKAMQVDGGIPDEKISSHVQKQFMLQQKTLYKMWEKALVKITEGNPLPPVFHLPRGGAKKVLVPLAEEIEADLIVMGTLARTGISGLLMGNTAETVLNQASCSVLALKPPGFKTPLTLD
jgi:nucleotide-binding universal stress UspA family protein